MSIWNHHSQICQIRKFLEKIKLPKFGTKNLLFGYFWCRILKNCCRIWNQHHQISQITKFLEKRTKCLNLGPKIAYLGFFRPEFWKYIIVFDTRTLKFVKVGNFVKRNIVNLGGKMLYSGFFQAIFFKNYCYLSNRHPQFCQIVKISRKNKIAKFSIKKALLRYFWVRILKNYCPIRNQLSQIV